MWMNILIPKGLMIFGFSSVTTFMLICYSSLSSLDGILSIYLKHFSVQTKSYEKMLHSGFFSSPDKRYSESSLHQSAILQPTSSSSPSSNRECAVKFSHWWFMQHDENHLYTGTGRWAGGHHDRNNVTDAHQTSRGEKLLPSYPVKWYVWVSKDNSP